MQKIMLAVLVCVSGSAFATPFRGIGPVRTLNPVAARQAIRADITKQYGNIKGLRISLKSDGLAADTFSAVGPKGKMGLRFSASGIVVQGAGEGTAKVGSIHLNLM